MLLCQIASVTIVAALIIMPSGVESKAHHRKGNNQVIMKMVYQFQKDIIQDKQQLSQLNSLTKQLKEESENLSKENTQLKEMIKEMNHQLHGKNSYNPENATLHRAKRQVNNPGIGGVGSGGAVFTRWGRKNCPQDAELVYSGIAGGSHYSHAGGGSNILCLPRVPQWGTTKVGFQSSGHLYGVEFRTSNNDPFQKTNTKGVTDLSLHDVVCATCRIPARVSHIMIPANRDCPSGWTKEYDGYLMSSAYTHKRSEYICVDSTPELDEKGSEDKGGALLYNTEAACGSLPCPDYISGAELTCVVCTK